MNEYAKQWVEALRSGDYAQGRDLLHRDQSGIDEYCCLGVACELFADHLGLSRGRSEMNLDAVTYSGEGYYLPGAVMELLGLCGACGDFTDDDGKTHSLAGMNDTGDTFEAIASKIESEPKWLFVANHH